MDGLESRRTRLVIALAFVTIISLFVLWQIIWTVFFALTIVYVLYPVRNQLVDRGLSPRIAAGVVTTAAVVGVAALFAPLLFVLYSRRQMFASFLRDLPLSVEVSVGEFSYVIEASALVPPIQSALQSLALEIAAAAPTLSAKLFLFIFLIYAILYRPSGARTVVFRVVDSSVQDELVAYHERVRGTLNGLYFVQAATGVLTLLIGLPVFYFLGYDAFFSLAVIAGILQFVPIVGPSVLVLTLGVVEVLAGNIEQATLVIVLGLALIGVLPDAILRPRLAKYSAGMPATVYFVGFLGGVFTIGPIGIIAGPLVLGLFIETLELLSTENDRPDDDITDEIDDPQATDGTVEQAAGESPKTDRVTDRTRTDEPGGMTDQKDTDSDIDEPISRDGRSETDPSTESEDE